MSELIRTLTRIVDLYSRDAVDHDKVMETAEQCVPFFSEAHAEIFDVLKHYYGEARKVDVPLLREFGMDMCISTALGSMESVEEANDYVVSNVKRLEPRLKQAIDALPGDSFTSFCSSVIRQGESALEDALRNKPRIPVERLILTAYCKSILLKEGYAGLVKKYGL